MTVTDDHIYLIEILRYSWPDYEFMWLVDMFEPPLQPWTLNQEIVQYHVLQGAETHCVNR